MVPHYVVAVTDPDGHFRTTGMPHGPFRARMLPRGDANAEAVKSGGLTLELAPE